MSQSLVAVDVSEIREGKLAELKSLMRELVEFVEEHEARPIAFQILLNSNAGTMTVVQVHPDSASMEFHMDAAAHIFPKFADLLTLSRIDLYGEPSDELIRRMRQKGRMLGNAPVAVHRVEAGFSRFAAGDGASG